MVSINTNLSSLLVQNNLTQSTNGLSKAIERLTTGYKINHASDNAAGYSIAQDMTSKLSSYDVAADNISMGLDLLSVAQNTISQMQTRGERLMALWTQAQNGTFGPTSISAINQEATAIMQEINRLYMNTEYNGIKLFEGGIKLPEWVDTVTKEAGLEEDLTPKYNGFIKEAHHMDDAEVNALTHVSELSSFVYGKTYAVSTAADLEKLQALVNHGWDTTNVTFIMGADIDFSEVEDDWYGIGTDSISSNKFNGTFDGNGHIISNFTLDNNLYSYDNGLFGDTSGYIKNVGMVNVDIDIQGTYGIGPIAGYLEEGAKIENCYSTGKVYVLYPYSDSGGLIGMTYGECSITDCYSTCEIMGGEDIGGLIGYFHQGEIKNCFATGNVTCPSGSCVGGLVGLTGGTITNCYATGNVTGTNKIGGLVGSSSGTISNSYANGTISGTSQVGGIVGYTEGNIDNCYAQCDVSGTECVGGIAGIVTIDRNGGNKTINNVYSDGSVSGTTSVGSLFGGMCERNNNKTASISITNACANSNYNAIGGVYENVTTLIEGDMSGWLDNITVLTSSSDITMQVGINGDSSCQISVDTTLNYDLSEVTSSGIESADVYNVLQKFLSQLSNKATELGATSNRLESALESTTVAMENITSSLSTIKDADIAKVSSEYIKKQILQQASATLLATANQSPSIALQLL